VRLVLNGEWVGRTAAATARAQWALRAHQGRHDGLWRGFREVKGDTDHLLGEDNPHNCRWHSGGTCDADCGDPSLLDCCGRSRCRIHTRECYDSDTDLIRVRESGHVLHECRGYLAPTSLGRELGPNDQVKILCIERGAIAPKP
jgi:hypothetical protein